jgi:hypothetical protein
MGGMKNAYKVLVGELKRKRSFGRPKRRWEDVRNDLGETEWELVDWMD